MKRIRTRPAAAMLGTTGIASAGIAVTSSRLRQRLDRLASRAKTQSLAPTAGSHGATSGCTTPPAPGLPGLSPSRASTRSAGLVNPRDLIDTEGAWPARWPGAGHRRRRFRVRRPAGQL